MAMYEGAQTVARTTGDSKAFNVKVGLHQGPVLSPLLFVIVMKIISRELRAGLPLQLLYADYLILMAESEESLRDKIVQKAQLMLTNTRDAFSSQSRSPNSTIPYVRYSFLLCNRNFVFKRRLFYDIRLQKCRDLEIRVRGHSRSLKVAPFERLCMVSYYCFLATLLLKRTIFFQNCHDLENRVRGPSRSLQMSPCDRAYMTSY